MSGLTFNTGDRLTDIAAQSLHKAYISKTELLSPNSWDEIYAALLDAVTSLRVQMNLREKNQETIRALCVTISAYALRFGSEFCIATPPRENRDNETMFKVQEPERGVGISEGSIQERRLGHSMQSLPQSVEGPEPRESAPEAPAKYIKVGGVVVSKAKRTKN